MNRKLPISKYSNLIEKIDLLNLISDPLLHNLLRSACERALELKKALTELPFAGSHPTRVVA